MSSYIAGDKMLLLRRTSLRHLLKLAYLELNKEKLRLPLLVLGVGGIYSIFLLMQTRSGVFFSGDGGLKFLMTEQLAGRKLFPYLDLPSPPWLKQLWAEGYYPFQPPFVYMVNQHYFMQYPVYFSILTAPAYALLGFKGLYLLPSVALWIIWITVLYLCRYLGANAGLTSLSLLALIFASPLTLYGAMYWEHTLGVALSMAGITIFLVSRDGNWFRAAVGGFLVGASVWFRSELACLVIIVIGLTWIPAIFRKLPNRRVFSVAIIMALTLLAILNFSLYGSPLGLHAIAIKLTTPLSQRMIGVASNFVRLVCLLMSFFPLAFVVLIYGLLATLRNKSDDSLISFKFLLWLSLLFIVFCPFILPAPELDGDGGKQWGPRYLLSTLPILCTIAPTAFCEMWRVSGRLLRTLFIANVFLAVMWGFMINSISGAQELSADYARRVLPASNEVVSLPARIVIVMNQCIAQELTATMRNKFFVLVRNKTELERVCKAAVEHGETKLLLIAYTPQFCDGLHLVRVGEHKYSVNMSLIGVRGIYALHDVSLRLLR